MTKSSALASNGDDSLLVDISDALSEPDRIRFTVYTRTMLPQFAKPVMSVVREHEEFIWLHDCLEDNDQYAGYIIPPPPPPPDFDSLREKLQRLGASQASMTKEEFAKMKQELEAVYLAGFKKTVAMHEMFLQRLAAHKKFREDNNFKIFLEYENELAVRSKSTKERIAGSISNIGKSLTDFVITTSQVAATTSASTSILAGHASSRPRLPSSTGGVAGAQQRQHNGNNFSSDSSNNINSINSVTSGTNNRSNTGDGNNNRHQENASFGGFSGEDNDVVDEQYFEKERLFLALYLNSIRETANQADKVTRMQKCVADSYLHIALQLVKLASIEVLPITAHTKDSSSFVSCPLPSLTYPSQPSGLYTGNGGSSGSGSTFKNILGESPSASSSSSPDTKSTSNAAKLDLSSDTRELGDDDDLSGSALTRNGGNDSKHGDKLHGASSSSGSAIGQARASSSSAGTASRSTGGCANEHTSEGLKKLLLHVSDYFEQARKVETRIASDEDLKLTDTFLYYKRDTIAAQDLLMRRLRFLAEYETATVNLEKSRPKGRTQMQYADVIQRQAKENFISISKLAKEELNDYKQRRVACFRKSFSDLVDLELKHLRSHSQLIKNCLNACRGLPTEPTNIQPGQRRHTQGASTSGQQTQIIASSSSSSPSGAHASHSASPTAILEEGSSSSDQVGASSGLGRVGGASVGQE